MTLRPKEDRLPACSRPLRAKQCRRSSRQPGPSLMFLSPRTANSGLCRIGHRANAAFLCLNLRELSPFHPVRPDDDHGHGVELAVAEQFVLPGVALGRVTAVLPKDHVVVGAHGAGAVADHGEVLVELLDVPGQGVVGIQDLPVLELHVIILEPGVFPEIRMVHPDGREYVFQRGLSFHLRVEIMLQGEGAHVDQPPGPFLLVVLGYPLQPASQIRHFYSRTHPSARGSS